MIPIILADFGSALLGVLLTFMAIFLILLVLVQRGRGGGLAGALGGMGGSSAFGAKAGDVFTKITIGAAAIWIALCIVADWWGSGYHSRVTGGSTRARTEVVAPADKDKTEPAGGADAAAAPGDTESPAPIGGAAAAPRSDAATAPASAPAATPASTPASAPADEASGVAETDAPSNP